MECIRVLKNNYYPSMRWSDRHTKNPGNRDLKSRIYSFLSSISGNDIESMIQSVLSKNELDRMQAKHISALKKISDSVNNKEVVKEKKTLFYTTTLHRWI